MSINLTVVIDNEEAVRRFRELQKTAKTVTSSVVTDADRMDVAMRRIATTLGQIGVAVSLTGLIRQIALTRGEFQQLEVAFSTLLQSKEKADKLMAEMVDLAAKTPFDLQGVASGARQLLAYGFAAEEITDTLTRLGNVAAGLGLPLERLTYLYGTTAVQGRLYARDMLQFTSSGIPVLQEMAKMYGKTTEEINKMVTDGKIGFEDVRKVIENMTNEGGQFYNLMQEQSKTITGLISNLGDALDTMFNDIGKSQEGIISSVLQGTISLVENYQKVLDILIPLVAAYGAYRAALIATAAVQKVQTTIAATKAILEQTKMLTRATQAQILFNQAVKANPYVLAASALIGLVTLMYRFSDGGYNAAKAQKDLNESIANASAGAITEQRELAQLKGELEGCTEGTKKYEAAKKKIIEKFGQYDSSLTQETLTVQTLTEKYNDLNTAILKSYNARQYDQFRSGQSQNLEETMTKNFDKIYSRLIDELGDEAGSKLYAQINNAILNGEAITPEIQSILDKIQDKGTIVADSRIDGWIKNIQSAIKLNDELDTQARKRFGIEGVVASTTTNETEKNAITSLSDTIAAAREKLAGLKSELADLMAGKLPKGAKPDFNWAKSIEDKQKAIKEQQEELNTLIGYDPKQAKKTTDAQKNLNEQVIANDQALLESRIALMKDGKAKELAEIDARTKAKLDAIDKERKEEEDRAKKAGIKLSPEREAIFTERERNARKQAGNDRIAVELKYAEDIDKIYKQITDDALSEDERRIRSVKDKYQEFRKWVESALKGGTINLEQAVALEWEIDSAEITASLKTIVDEYGSAEDKIAKIREKAANAQKTATESGRMDLIPRIDKREREEIGEVKAEELMKTDDWINLFQNLDALSSKEIRRIIDNINEQLKNANLDPINLKAVTDQLDKAAETATRKNPFAAIAVNFKAYKQALTNGDDLRAVKLRQEAWQSVVSAIGEAGNTLGSVSNLLGQFGIESAELDGFIGAINSLASIDITNPFSIASGVIGGLSSLIGGIFGGHDKRAEKRIEKLQDQVDALQKSYENLGDTIDKAYSTDASNLIGQQNEMLEQQKVLIQNQIKEEQSKKDPDKGRIKDWQNQIDEINKVIADNKEKAIDAIFGEDLKTAIENFADAYSEAWTSGEDRVKATKDVVKNMMRQMVIESIKAAMQSSEAMANIREKLLDFYSDKTFSKWEQDYIYDMAEKLQKELDDQFGWADSLFKDKTTSSQTATSRGFQAMSQDTGDELNGRFTDMQGKMNILVSGMDMLRSINMDTRNTSIDIRDIMIQLNGNVADIRTFTRVLPEMSSTLTSMNKKLDNL